MNKAKLQQTILLLYNEDPSIVNDESRLLEQVWLKYGWSDSRSLYDNLSRLPRPESISRRRRELHNLGLIQYSNEALDDRMEAFKNERDEHSNFIETPWKD